MSSGRKGGSATSKKVRAKGKGTRTGKGKADYVSKPDTIHEEKQTDVACEEEGSVQDSKVKQMFQDRATHLVKEGKPEDASVVNKIYHEDVCGPDMKKSKKRHSEACDTERIPEGPTKKDNVGTALRRRHPERLASVVNVATPWRSRRDSKRSRTRSKSPALAAGGTQTPDALLSQEPDDNNSILPQYLVEAFTQKIDSLSTAKKYTEAGALQEKMESCEKVVQRLVQKRKFNEINCLCQQYLQECCAETEVLTKKTRDMDEDEVRHGHRAKESLRSTYHEDLPLDMREEPRHRGRQEGGKGRKEIKRQRDVADERPRSSSHMSDDMDDDHHQAGRKSHRKAADAYVQEKTPRNDIMSATEFQTLLKRAVTEHDVMLVHDLTERYMSQANQIPKSSSVNDRDHGSVGNQNDRRAPLPTPTRTPTRMNWEINSSEPWEIKDLGKQHARLPRYVELQNVRILAVSQMVAAKGKGKGKDKGKAKGKGKNGGSSEKMSVTIYVGDNEGYIGMVHINGLPQIPSSWANRPLYTLRGLTPRIGANAICDMNDAKDENFVKVGNQREPFEQNNYPYCVEVCRDFASLSFIKNYLTVNDMVSFPVRVDRIEQKMTQVDEPYIVLNATDMDNYQTGPLRIWRYSESDVDPTPGRIWMLRGMKVNYASTWDGITRSFVRAMPESLIPEACIHTAIEDVTDVDSIIDLFR